MTQKEMIDEAKEMKRAVKQSPEVAELVNRIKILPLDKALDIFADKIVLVHVSAYVTGFERGIEKNVP